MIYWLATRLECEQGTYQRSRKIPNFLHLLIIGGVKCCTRNSNLRHYSDLKYKHHSLAIDYLDVPINHLFFATSLGDLATVIDTEENAV